MENPDHAELLARIKELTHLLAPERRDEAKAVMVVRAMEEMSARSLARFRDLVARDTSMRHLIDLVDGHIALREILWDIQTVGE